MSEYLTEFGEFEDFESNETGVAEYSDPNLQFIPISDFDITQSPIFPQIQEVVTKFKEEKQAQNK